jgi:hypothetical protein
MSNKWLMYGKANWFFQKLLLSFWNVLFFIGACLLLMSVVHDYICYCGHGSSPVKLISLTVSLFDHDYCVVLVWCNCQWVTFVTGTRVVVWVASANGRLVTPHLPLHPVQLQPHPAWSWGSCVVTVTRLPSCPTSQPHTSSTDAPAVVGAWTWGRRYQACSGSRHRSGCLSVCHPVLPFSCYLSLCSPPDLKHVSPVCSQLVGRYGCGQGLVRSYNIPASSIRMYIGIYQPCHPCWKQYLKLFCSDLLWCVTSPF